MNHLNFFTAQNPDSLAQQLAHDVAHELQAALSIRPQATLVVSGGSTPKPFFAYLSQIDLDWKNILVTLADERCVGANDPQSNARFVHENLLQNKASAAKFLPLFEASEPNHEAAQTISAKLAELPTYDVVILGMGGDGHTASIFPKATNRAEALDQEQITSALLVDPVTVTPLRVTQTATRLLNTRFLALHVTGQEKNDLLQSICAQPDAERWPISVFLEQQSVPMRIYRDKQTSL